ncbi:MAG: molybdopterin biosynthesis protein [Caldilineales bacterium]|nr:molybdopterin biosynthesis protein [Caldilineales bacterium]
MTYLHDIPLDEAIAAWHGALLEIGALRRLSSESLPVAEANGRITAAPVWARISVPHYHAAAMDGYAVRATETVGATLTRPLRLELGTQAAYVDTGDPIPAQFDAVIPIEEAQRLETEPGPVIEILAAVTPWNHVRTMGEDIVATELVVPANHRLRPQDLGAIAGSGHSEVQVYRRPRIAILPTGTELVAPGSDLKPGDIIEFNSIILSAMAQDWNACANRLPMLADDYEAIKKTVIAALEDHDLVVVNAGSSAGSEDYTARIIAELGEVQVHGIAIRPGHPVVLGHARGKPVVGIPGYPVSAMITFELLVKPLLQQWMGQEPQAWPTVQATITRKVLSPMGQDEYMRVTLGRVENAAGDARIVATPLSRGAGVIMSMVRADGIAHIPRFSEGLNAGDPVTVELLRPPGVIDQTIVHLGSHDLTLDLLADQLRRLHPNRSFSSGNVGSLSGLLALRRGEAHLAGSHLLDAETGEYNLSYIRRYLSDEPVVVLGFVGRTQGLITPPGNPKALAGLADLVRSDIVYVNRQRGAGTRVLLDYHLQNLGIDPAGIQGYDRVEFTHLAVAAAVASGAADCGLGILAAARALHLDFIPLFEEQYQLIIPRRFYESDLLAPLLEIIRSEGFRQAVSALGGYDVGHMGEILASID